MSNILTSALGTYLVNRNYGENAQRWENIHSTIAHELGIHSLGDSYDVYENCIHFLQHGKTDEVLDLIEYSFVVISKLSYHPNDKFRNAISELNYRFREHGIGYQLDSDKLIRVDSEFVHAEVVKPTLVLLHESAFHGASEEFLKAHEHYRAGRYPEAIAASLNAFESTMKTVCDLRQWSYPSNATARVLIDTVFKNGLIPAEMVSEFTALRSTLESGLPTIRNRAGGHGQGKDPVQIPSHLASYAIHLAAANILFLVQSHKNFR